MSLHGRSGQRQVSGITKVCVLKAKSFCSSISQKKAPNYHATLKWKNKNKDHNGRRLQYERLQLQGSLTESCLFCSVVYSYIGRHSCTASPENQTHHIPGSHCCSRYTCFKHTTSTSYNVMLLCIKPCIKKNTHLINNCPDCGQFKGLSVLVNWSGFVRTGLIAAPCGRFEFSSFGPQREIMSSSEVRIKLYKKVFPIRSLAFFWQRHSSVLSFKEQCRP